MDMELRHLRAVLAIAEAGSLTAAASRLGLAQPSVSESLRRAERVAGGPLFQRGPSGAVPTALGDVVLAHAVSVLEAMDRFTAAAERHHPATMPAAVRFACSPGMLVASLSVLDPSVLGAPVLVRTMAEIGAQLELLADHRVEAALVVEHPDPLAHLTTRVRRRVVAVEPMFIAVSADHPLADRSEVPITALTRETWCVGDSADDGLADHLAAALGPTTVDIRVGVDHTTALQLAELGQAVLVAMPGSRPRAGLVQLALTDNPLRSTTSLLWNTGGPLAQAHIDRLWVELVRAQHEVVEQTPAYRDWLARHPQWVTTPADLGPQG
ncbi:LysR family transcriptional regulator [Actinokineospora globicatena]|uniref:LysR family transcriptional regulator n=1 Tax=Actinokineospora globicatena TaxID=103729 RepID=UPI0020A293D4|nr:LysR family transcriptional regulator [Actinokineospora globicatena]MCP2302706.1 DNA-binding transcriptional regulator, LysR family [Actinokineospora globicatena]GLW75606.1 LysR family transcriptional regulator [Actinokineospora globicatena]GLW82446.1 LysR family transcriptional regulator [Actinokineospora globicatena]